MYTNYKSIREELLYIVISKDKELIKILKLTNILILIKVLKLIRILILVLESKLKLIFLIVFNRLYIL